MGTLQGPAIHMNEVGKREKCPRKRAMQLKKCRTSRLRAMLATASFIMHYPDEEAAPREDLERTSARHAHRVRKCTEANPGGLQPVESARQFQNRVVRHPGR